MPHHTPHLGKSANAVAHRPTLQRFLAYLMKLVLLIVSGSLIAIICVGALWTQLIAAQITNSYPPGGIFVPVTGGKLHLRDIGPRNAAPERTILLIHGASGNHKSLLQPLEPYLRDRYRIIAIDRPGHGYSDRPYGREDASPTRQAALISEAMAAIGAKRALVLAHSYGGAVATTLAMDHPEKVAPVPQPAPKPALALRPPVNIPFIRDNRQSRGLATRARWWTDGRAS